MTRFSSLSKHPDWLRALLSIHAVAAVGYFIRAKVATTFRLSLRTIYLILPVALGPGVYSAYNRNEYQKHKK
jgi:hypothetical protein